MLNGLPELLVLAVDQATEVFVNCVAALHIEDIPQADGFSLQIDIDGVRFCPQSGNVLVCIGRGGGRGHDKFFNLPDDILLPVKLSEDETFKVLLKELLELEEELAMRGRQAFVVLCEILVIEEADHQVLGVSLSV